MKNTELQNLIKRKSQEFEAILVEARSENLKSKKKEVGFYQTAAPSTRNNVTKKHSILKRSNSRNSNKSYFDDDEERK